MIVPNGMAVIRALLEHPEGLETKALAARIGVTAMSLPPIVRHLSMKARKSGLNLDQIISRTQKFSGNGIITEYVMTEEAAVKMKPAVTMP